MAFGNPPVPWRDIERTLSGRDPHPHIHQRGSSGQRDAGIGDGSDSPAWSRKREKYEAPAIRRRRSTTPYAELHCHSSFSFLDGASDPEVLAEEAAALGLEALAITDHDGFYGVVRFAEAARAVGLPTVFGAELTLDKLDITPGQADPDGGHLLVLARDPVGYAALARVISEAQLAGEKGAPRMSMSSLDRWLRDDERDHWQVLTGCRKGSVNRALEREGPAAAERALVDLVDRFGRSNVAVELWDHGSPLDSVRNDALVGLADRVGVDVIATNNVHYATPADRRLASAMAAVRSRRSLDEIDGWLPAAASAHLRSGDEQTRRFARYPGVVERAAELGLACAFDLSLMAPKLPPFPCPDGPDGTPMSEMAFLRHLVEERGVDRYGPRDAEWVSGAWTQLDHELDLIEALGFPGYFLVVWDIVEFCRKADILCQGRGSAANSAVCYVLGVTKADAVSLGLLFERFLAPERDGPPDIDLDIESDRREEAIQYVYERHGRRHAAQVANVITYRAKSAIRDAAKALGYATGQQDAFAKATDRWSGLASNTNKTQQTDHGIPGDVLELAAKFEDLPRHLGIHSGGMVMCDRPVIEVCPVEWGRMEGRTVLQWDKDDCAAAGLVKFDLLGLGMLSALHYAVDLIAEHHDTEIDLATVPQEDAVYDMLCHADSVGVFQVESRAQMSTLPRLRPRTFYDLVVEIALIRPGPIQGGSVHPYIRRRNGEEPVTYLHPLLEPALEKTLGIPLFQEQLMQMAIDISGFSAAEADQLRRAMGSKRSRRKMEAMQARLYAGMTSKGVEAEVQEEIWHKLVAFANYGFPESHSISFAYLVYSSSWLKLHYPAAFCAALLNAQPMGFYSPHSLVQDARRHGVPTRPPHVNESLAGATLEPEGDTSPVPMTVADPELIRRERLDHGWAVRLGLRSVRTIGVDVADAMEAERRERGAFVSIEDVARRCGLKGDQLEALATAGALDGLATTDGGPAATGATAAEPSAPSRREALWIAGAVVKGGADKLEGIVTGVEAPQLPGLSDHELAMADLWATGVAADGHPTVFLRRQLDTMGVTPANRMADIPDGDRILVAGVVTHRQRPATASGTTFMGLEDETGLINVVVSKGCWEHHRVVARSTPALLIRGRCQKQGAVVNVVAEVITPLPIGRSADGDAPTATPAVSSMSRDFR